MGDAKRDSSRTGTDQGDGEEDLLNLLPPPPPLWEASSNAAGGGEGFHGLVIVPRGAGDLCPDPAPMADPTGEAEPSRFV